MGKYLDLGISIIIDIIGAGSYLIPGAGEVADLIVAPINTMWIFNLVDKSGTGYLDEIGDVLLTMIGGAEELSPGLDIIPSATIAWIYTYHISKR